MKRRANKEEGGREERMRAMKSISALTLRMTQLHTEPQVHVSEPPRPRLHVFNEGVVCNVLFHVYSILYLPQIQNNALVTMQVPT